MKWHILLLLGFLSLITSSAYSRILGEGMLVADPVMILFAWICLVDHWSRIAAVGGALILYRLWETVATPLEVIAPFVAIAIIVRIIRGGISPYHRWRRLAIVIPALLVAGWITRNMFELESIRGFSGVFLDLLLAFIVASILFPLLDLTRPLLRSARFPQ